MPHTTSSIGSSITSIHNFALSIALLNDLHEEPGNSKLDEKKRCRSEGSLLGKY